MHSQGLKDLPNGFDALARSIDGDLEAIRHKTLQIEGVHGIQNENLTPSARYRKINGSVEMKAIILAAGRGRRIARLSDQAPKCLIEVSGKPLIDLQIAALKRGGVSEIGIVTGVQKEALEDRKLPEFHNPDWSTTNMVKSLCMADAFFFFWLSSSPCQ